MAGRFGYDAAMAVAYLLFRLPLHVRAGVRADSSFSPPSPMALPTLPFPSHSTGIAGRLGGGGQAGLQRVPAAVSCAAAPRRLLRRPARAEASRQTADPLTCLGRGRRQSRQQCRKCLWRWRQEAETENNVQRFLFVIIYVAFQQSVHNISSNFLSHQWPPPGSRSHSSPMKPPTHVQTSRWVRKPTIAQVPPFSHGFGTQLPPASILQRSPKKSLMQMQEASMIGKPTAAHSPPLRQGFGSHHAASS